MSAIDSEAIEGLGAAVDALLAGVATPSVQLSALVAPSQITPVGIGGLAGINEDPRGEILGRRLEAKAMVTARAADFDALNDAVAAVTRTFMGAERAALLEQGILRLTLDDAGTLSASVNGATTEIERTLSFEVLYEFLKIPEHAENVIREVPTNLNAT